MAATQKLIVDDGLVRLDINGNGLLVFNPSDFNLYNRFTAFVKELPEIEEKYRLEVENTESEEITALVGAELAKAQMIDRDVKERMNAVFGGADFDRLLGGVNCMAFGSNGDRVITNLLNALLPYFEGGVRQHMENAAATAKKNRQQRRAQR